MSGIAPDVWLRLAGERAQGEALWARRAAAETTERLIAALDADDKRHLLVRLLVGEADLQDRQSRGLAVVTRELAVRGHEAGRYLDIICNDKAGHEAFNLIGGEIAERLVTARETAPEIVARVLAKWRRFWGQLPKPMLSHEEQLGLFAELWFLSVWLFPQVGVSRALDGWRGCSGARHDFEWPGRSVEVKATTSTRGLIHRVHGLDQLAPPEGGALLFFSLQLREEGGATNTLPKLVTACRTQLEADAEALTRFEFALAQVGYSPAHDPEYAKVTVRIVKEGLYRVENDFPRLTHASFAGGLPAGVEHVEYEVNLCGIDHLLAAEKPEQASFL